jgi:6-pyruvoyl-tetrahydropterin synthase
MLSFIKVQFDFEGFHQYDGAPLEVGYLKNLHRHLFNVQVTIEVTHDDRELEFFMVKRELIDMIKVIYPKSIVGSCEMVAKDLYHFTKHKYGQKRFVKVEVYEDKENGGIVTDTNYGTL